jgi:transposase
VTELRQRYDTAPEANVRLRYPMVLLAHQGRSGAAIAPMVFHSRDTVERGLRRFLHGGVTAIPRRTAPGRAPTVTAAGKAELLRVIDLDPHMVGVHSANGTTGLLATSLATTPRMTVTAETVRLYLRAAGSGCKRPPGTLTRTAEEPPGYGGNASGGR